MIGAQLKDVWVGIGRRDGSSVRYAIEVDNGAMCFATIL